MLSQAVLSFQLPFAVVPLIQFTGDRRWMGEFASRRWVQLTHDSGRNDFPTWAPDGRHIVFEREEGHRSNIWSMLADGTEQHQLTHEGNNTMPNWSWK